MLSAENVTVRYGQKTVVDRLSFTLSEGQWLMLAGPNGAGKSSLVRALTRAVPFEGTVRLNGQDIRAWTSAQTARWMGVLAQQNSVGYAYTVDEIVQLGRYAHRKNLFSAHDPEGRDKVDEALHATGMTDLRRASMLELSGGEQQRAFLAQVFAQDPRILLLDEPANHLDLKYQQQIFSLIQDWLRQPGRAVLSVVHDLALARKYGDRALLLDRGKCVAQGDTAHVLTRENLQAVYGMDVHAWMAGLYAPWREDGDRTSGLRPSAASIVASPLHADIARFG